MSYRRSIGDIGQGGRERRANAINGVDPDLALAQVRRSRRSWIAHPIR